MTDLLVSYDHYQYDWYVGELYKNFVNFLKSKNISIEYINIKELANKYNYNYNINSIFSIYNLIITNKKTHKTFIHSLYDGAPAMMDANSGINNFDIIGFSCCSNLTQNIIDKYSSKYNIYPSFYILENFSDMTYIEKYFNNKKNKSKKFKCYFNGLCYGHRGLFKLALHDNQYFEFKDKSNSNDFRQKINYFDDLTNCMFGLSLNGAAKICYRDIEYFGLGVLCLREKLDILTYSPIEENIHYINFIDHEINNLLYSNKFNELNNLINEKLITIDKNYNINNIINNARNWYINNAMLDSQCTILYKFLQKTGII